MTGSLSNVMRFDGGRQGHDRRGASWNLEGRWREN